MNETIKPIADPRATPGDPVVAKVAVSRHGAVVTLTLNRPAALNAFDDEMRRVFADEMARIARNPDIYVVVLNSASPKAFCAFHLRARYGGQVCGPGTMARAALPRARF